MRRQGQLTREDWMLCVLCGFPYEEEDLHSIGTGKYVCRWHLRQLRRKAAA